jgi:hypothetical protein
LCPPDILLTFSQESKLIDAVRAPRDLTEACRQSTKQSTLLCAPFRRYRLDRIIRQERKTTTTKRKTFKLG